MTPEQAAEFAAELNVQAQRVMSKLPLLGAVTWLMLQHNSTRHTLISDQEWRVLPPLVLDQAKLYMRDNAPIAYVSWAKLSDKVAQRYMAEPHQLASGDWQSGDQVWIVDLFAPFGGAAEVLQDLRDKVLKGQVIRQLPVKGLIPSPA
ncbi:MAG: toxin-activating lysine-acyltransferase [Betaproteobacteria bacterium]|nr:toxin-activating lysine-acyltransferase [Betaproteobacteria bacterium]